jgi:DNA-binding MarR family transcriptional regulator
MMKEHVEFENALKEWIGQVMQLSMKDFIEYSAETRLSMPQIAMLVRLNDRKHCAVTELGEEFGVSGAAASQMVEKLVQMGLLERVEDANDRRVRRLLLTPKGKTIVERNFEARQGWIKGFCATVTPEFARNAAHMFRELMDAAQRFEAGERFESQHHPCQDARRAARPHPRSV